MVSFGTGRGTKFRNVVRNKHISNSNNRECPISRQQPSNESLLVQGLAPMIQQVKSALEFLTGNRISISETLLSAWLTTGQL